MRHEKMFVILLALVLVSVVLCSCGRDDADGVNSAESAYTWSRQADIGIMGISACAPDHAWAVAWDKMYFFDGNSWTQRVEPQSVVEHVFCLDPQHSWASGQTGTIYFYDGLIWANQGETFEFINGISGTDPEHVWAAGGLGTIYFFDGDSWTKQYEGDTGFDAVFALDSQHAWAATGSAIYFFDGDTWSVQDDSMGARDISGVDDSHVWAMKDASIYFFDGADWSEQFTLESQTPGLLMTPTIMDIFAADPSHVWAVGTDENGGVIFFFDGNSWDRQYVDEVAANFQCVFALDEDHVWAGTGEGIYFGTTMP